MSSVDYFFYRIPFSRSFVLREGAHMGINQEIGINDDQLKDSPSAIASGLGYVVQAADFASTQ